MDFQNHLSSAAHMLIKFSTFLSPGNLEILFHFPYFVLLFFFAIVCFSIICWDFKTEVSRKINGSHSIPLIY